MHIQVTNCFNTVSNICSNSGTSLNRLLHPACVKLIKHYLVTDYTSTAVLTGTPRQHSHRDREIRIVSGDDTTKSNPSPSSFTPTPPAPVPISPSWMAPLLLKPLSRNLTHHFDKREKLGHLCSRRKKEFNLLPRTEQEGHDPPPSRATHFP